MLFIVACCLLLFRLHHSAAFFSLLQDFERQICLSRNIVVIINFLNFKKGSSMVHLKVYLGDAARRF